MDLEKVIFDIDGKTYEFDYEKFDNCIFVKKVRDFKSNQTSVLVEDRVDKRWYDFSTRIFIDKVFILMNKEKLLNLGVLQEIQNKTNK
jgi:hypothetical protein